MGKHNNNLPSKHQIALFWRDKKIDGQPIIIDFGEPCCWACGNWNYVKNEGYYIESKKFYQLWNDPLNGLERCHIIPRALGGTDEIDNLFLMCGNCHKASPDTLNRNYFFDWILNRSLGDSIKETPKFKACVRLLNEGYTYVEVSLFLDKLKTKEIGLDLKINTHSFTYSDSTLLYSYIDAFNKFIESEVVVYE